MRHDCKTIFRVVGGNSQRKVLNEYEIIPYLVIKETPRYYTVSRNGRTELQNKRTTSNSEWFTDLSDALSAIERKIETAIKSVHESQVYVSQSSFIGLPYNNRLYMAEFRKEKFDIRCRKILGKTKNAWRTDTERTREHTNFKTKETRTVPAGKRGGYIDYHQAQPHNPKHPFERWYGTDLDLIKKAVELYASERLRYLERCRQKIREWVRLFEQEHDTNGENG